LNYGEEDDLGENLNIFVLNLLNSSRFLIMGSFLIQGWGSFRDVYCKLNSVHPSILYF